MKYKVLLICDCRNWAYDAIAKNLVKYNTNLNLSFEIFYLKEARDNFEETSGEFDYLFFMGWQNLFEEKKSFLTRRVTYEKIFPFVDTSKVITGIHSHHSWDNRKTMPDLSIDPPIALVEALNSCLSVNAVSLRLTELFRKNGLANVVYTQNGVDVHEFTQNENIGEREKLHVGFSGSLKHDWRKGITEFITPAVEEAEMELVKAVSGKGEFVPLEEMPDFYKNLDVYLCASSSEGFSLSVLEASSSGVPVISTKVGGCEDLIEDGVNGFLVDRSVNKMVEKLRYLDQNRETLSTMGQKNRSVVESNYTWEKSCKIWIDFISGSIQKSQ
ncbi:glycosyltransferase family 4 protein [Bacteriovoracaceae bacterium]|nr:glycosyltransferase family 4 protein [Bacteriovoracaceae bacterium]